MSLFSRLTSFVNLRYTYELLKFTLNILKKEMNIFEDLGFHGVFIIKNLIETSLICDFKVQYLELMGFLLEFSNKYPFAAGVYSNFYETERLLIENKF